jgi:hypothetical protein
MAIETIGSDFLRSVRKYYRLAIVQHAAPFPSHDFSEYDLALSSLPNQLDCFRQQGMKAELLRLGFEPHILDCLSSTDRRFDLVFVGGLGRHHQEGALILEELSKRHEVSVWGYGIEDMPENSSIREVYNGPVWGKEMYEVLQNAKIVFNRHIGVAEDYANNMRLYEATGIGTLLLTDQKRNLADLFDPAREVVAYRDADECLDLAEYYLTHDVERETIARSGQQRTLREHTYYQRMQELLDIVHRYI